MLQLIYLYVAFIKPQEIERLRFFYRGKELQPETLPLNQIGVVTEAKNEEGLMVKVAVGILVHAVRKDSL